MAHQVLKHPGGSSGETVLEKHEPGLGQGPGRHDVGDHGQLIDKFSARHVGADDQPGQGAADQECKQGSPDGYGHRMLQRGVHVDLPEHARQHPDIVKSSQLADFSVWDAGEIMRLPGHRGLDHPIQRNDDQVEHQDQHEQG